MFNQGEIQVENSGDMYSVKKNDRVKRCKIIDLQSKLLSKYTILTMVFQAPNSRAMSRQEQGMQYLRYFSKDVTSQLRLTDGKESCLQKRYILMY